MRPTRTPADPPLQDGTATQKTFVHVPSSIEAEEAEEIGVEHLLRDVKNLSVGTLSSRVSDQLSSLRGMQSRLTEVKEYLESVVKGTLPVNHQIIYNLQDIFNLLPNLDAAEHAGEGAKGAKRPFTVATNDQLLVMYLSSLIRTVIALHDLVRFPLPVSCPGPGLTLAVGCRCSTSRRVQLRDPERRRSRTRRRRRTRTRRRRPTRQTSRVRKTRQRRGSPAATRRRTTHPRTAMTRRVTEGEVDGLKTHMQTYR